MPNRESHAVGSVLQLRFGLQNLVQAAQARNEVAKLDIAGILVKAPVPILPYHQLRQVHWRTHDPDGRAAQQIGQAGRAPLGSFGELRAQQEAVGGTAAMLAGRIRSRRDLPAASSCAWRDGPRKPTGPAFTHEAPGMKPFCRRFGGGVQLRCFWFTAARPCVSSAALAMVSQVSADRLVHRPAIRKVGPFGCRALRSIDLDSRHGCLIPKARVASDLPLTG